MDAGKIRKCVVAVVLIAVFVAGSVTQAPALGQSPTIASSSAQISVAEPVNLAPNPSFEEGGSAPTGWVPETEWPRCGTVDYVWDNSVAHSGSRSLAIKNFIPAWCTLINPNQDLAIGDWRTPGYIAIDPTHDYQISGWYRNTTQTESVALLAIMWGDKSYALGSTGVWGMGPAGDWTFRTAVISSRTLQQYFPGVDRVQLHFGGSSETASSGGVWIDDVEFVDITGTGSYSISGHINDAASGLVISGVTISDGAGHSTTTDTDGNYTLSGLPAGSYMLSASKNGYPGYYRFWPTGYSINLTANVAGQDFFRILDVPLLWQDDPNSNWAGDTYNLYPGNTIARWGCATTSAAMVLNYYGAPSGVQTDPKELDDWLATNSGYVPIEHEVVWGQVGVFADKRKGLTMGVKKPPFVAVSEANLDNALAAGIPPIVNVCCAENAGWHWVVVTGKIKMNGAYTYSINDPLVHGYDTLGQYSVWSKMLRYESGPSVKPLPGVWLYLCSPANMLVTDSLGRRAGIDPTSGQEVSEIPGASYADEYLSPADTSDATLMHTKTLVLSESGTYKVEVTGTDEGSYTLLALSSGSNGELLSQSTTRPVHLGQSDSFVLDYSSVGEGQLLLTPRVHIYIPIVLKN